jgi:hypothetical protein
VNKFRVIVIEFDGDASGDQFLSTLREVFGRQPEPAKSVSRVVVEPTATPPQCSEQSAKVDTTPPPKPRPVAPPEEPTNRAEVKFQTYAAHVLELLRATPGMPPTDIAKEVYGSSIRENVIKVQAQFGYLSKQGRIKRIGFNRYEVVR